jgi:outer membrane protein
VTTKKSGLSPNALRLLVLAGIIVVVAGGVYALMASGATAVGQTLNIGYVDMQRALDAHPKKAAQEEALNQFARVKMTEARQQAQGKPPADQQRIQRAATEEVLKRQRDLFSGLDKDIRSAVDKVGRGAGVLVVLDRSVVLYGGTDLTDQVIKELKGQ